MNNLDEKIKQIRMRFDNLQGKYASDFDESEHPREDNGQFAPKGRSGGSGGTMSVESDSGKTIHIDIGNEIESVMKQIKDEKSTLTNKRIWGLIDSNNKFFKSIPSQKGLEGRAKLNQAIFEGVLSKLGRKF